MDRTVRVGNPVTSWRSGFDHATGLRSRLGMALSWRWPGPRWTATGHAGVDGNAAVWDPAPAALSASRDIAEVDAVVWSPDGTCLAAGGWATESRLWNPTTGDRPTSPGTPLDGRPWSPDGAGWPPRPLRNVHLWDPATGRMYRDPRQPTVPTWPGLLTAATWPPSAWTASSCTASPTATSASPARAGVDGCLVRRRHRRGRRRRVGGARAPDATLISGRPPGRIPTTPGGARVASQLCHRDPPWPDDHARPAAQGGARPPRGRAGHPLRPGHVRGPRARLRLDDRGWPGTAADCRSPRSRRRWPRTRRASRCSGASTSSATRCRWPRSTAWRSTRWCGPPGSPARRSSWPPRWPRPRPAPTARGDLPPGIGRPATRALFGAGEAEHPGPDRRAHRGGTAGPARRRPESRAHPRRDTGRAGDVAEVATPEALT